MWWCYWLPQHLVKHFQQVQQKHHFPPSLLPAWNYINIKFWLKEGTRLQTIFKETYLQLIFWNIIFNRVYSHNLINYCCSLQSKTHSFDFSLSTAKQKRMHAHWKWLPNTISKLMKSWNWRKCLFRWCHGCNLIRYMK